MTDHGGAQDGRSAGIVDGAKELSAAQRRGRKQDKVYESVRRRILEGDLSAGARIRIDEVCRELDVSHIPVREALKRLQAEGYVTIEPYVGTTVTDLPMEWIEEVFELLEAAETISVRAVCRTGGDAALTDIRAAVDRMDELVHDPEAWSLANVELHSLICSAGGKLLTGRMLKAVLDNWDRLRRRYLAEVSALRLTVAQREHRAIASALEARDEAQAVALVRQHNRAAFADYARHLDMAKAPKAPALRENSVK